MREKLTAALQARWEESLLQRAAIDPHSPVPLLDNLLAPFRAAPAGQPSPAATIGMLKGQRYVLGSHTWRLLLRLPVLRDSGGAAHRDRALRRPLRISAPVRLH
jgi:hypothetical protein